jgi:TPP-dependent pyruvate/acetoin dehydrogenase alpha subunit
MIERLYQSLYLIRRAEERVAEVYPTDKIKSPVHLSIGQEAVAVAVCDPLRADDIVFCSYRSHASYLAKGGDLNAMVAELYGKATGCAKGKGGSMHLVDPSKGVMGASAVVGTTLPQAVGYAYGLKQRGTDSLVVTFFGDGASDEGVFFESLNFAALKKAPVLFICENNGFAIFTRQSARQSGEKIHVKAAQFGLHTEYVPDDVLLLRERVEAAITHIRAGKGPVLLECDTYRWKEHVGPGEDFQFGHRSHAEAAPWLANDQVKRVAGMLPADVRAHIEREVEAKLAAAFEFAENSPFPDLSELYTDVYKARS